MADNIDVRVRIRDARRFNADAKAAGRSIKSIGDAGERARSRLKGAAAGIAGLAAGYLSLSAAKDAITTTVDLAKGTLALSRNLGLTNKQASQWAAVAQARGVDTNQLSTSFTNLSKNVSAALGGSKQARASFAALGVTQQDLVRGSDDFQFLLGQVADGLGDLKGGSDRATLAQKLLGRSSQNTLPIFTQGRKSMEENLALADKYGVTLGDKPISSLQDMIHMQKELEFAQLGWQVTLATKVAPVLTKVIGLVTDLSNGLREGKTWAVALAVGVGSLAAILLGYSVVANTIEAITGAWAAAQWLLNGALLANPLVLIAVAVVALAAAIYIAYQRSATFRAIVQSVWTWLRGAANWISTAAVSAFHVLSGAVQRAWSIFKLTPEVWIITHLGQIVGFIRGMPGRIASAASGMWNGIKDSFRSAINWIIGAWNGLNFHIGGQSLGPLGHLPAINIGTPDIPLLGQGGTITASGTAVVGERGPELVHLPRAAQVQPLTASDGAINLRAVLVLPDGRVLTDLVAKNVARDRAAR